MIILLMNTFLFSHGSMVLPHGVPIVECGVRGVQRATLCAVCGCCVWSRASCSLQQTKALLGLIYSGWDVSIMGFSFLLGLG